MPAFNTDQPATLGALANYYTGNPNLTPDQVQTNTNLNSSEAADWLMQQGQKLGIGDPSTYFQKAVDANKLAATPSGAQMNAAQMAGQFSPSSLPGQLQARDAMVNQASTIAAQQQSQQNDQSIINNPMIPGQTPSLSPMEQQYANAAGITPSAFMLNKRLGPNSQTWNANPTNRFVGNNAQGLANPQDVYLNPAFQRYMQDPKSATNAPHVFKALTNTDLQQFQQTYQASQGKSRSDQIAELTKQMQSQDIIPDPNNPGKILARQYKSDPVTGAPVLTNNYGPGSSYQQSLAPLMPEVNKTIADFATLQQKKNYEQAQTAQSAGVAMQNRGPITAQDVQGSSDSNYPGLLGNLIQGARGEVGRAVGNLVSGGTAAQPVFWKSGSAEDFTAPTGVAPLHAAPILRNNPQFQKLMQTNPAAAHRMILAIQQLPSAKAAAAEPSYNEVSGY